MMQSNRRIEHNALSDTRQINFSEIATLKKNQTTNVSYDSVQFECRSNKTSVNAHLPCTVKITNIRDLLV